MKTIIIIAGPGKQGKQEFIEKILQKPLLKITDFQHSEELKDYPSNNIVIHIDTRKVEKWNSFLRLASQNNYVVMTFLVPRLYALNNLEYFSKLNIFLKAKFLK